MSKASIHYLRKNPASENTDSGALRFGERLLQDERITKDQLQIALHEQRRNGQLLGSTLVQLGFLKESDLADMLAERTGFRSIDLKNTITDPDLMSQLPRAVAERCRALPVRLTDTTLEIAMADPYDVIAMDEIRRYFPRHLDLAPFVAPAADIADILDHSSGFHASLDGILKEFETGEQNAASGIWEHPVVKLVNTVLFDAVRRNASDIHLEPESGFIRLRYRIDGIMQQVRALHRSHWPELSHRLKIMAGMNIADTRSLQDGRFQLQVGGANIDFRMAVMPTSQGENIVIRVLDHRHVLVPLDQLGFPGDALKQLELILDRPEGIVLVTGPTGCGKTTTLYSMLNRISSIDVNIMTLEEPIEYQFNLIRQTAIQEQQGMTFAEGVRGILRQDPDIIFIGEVRDGDTAQMALRASMTGHQIFSTLHCNDALGAVPRLIDLGLQPSMLAGNITGIIAQRLTRKLCKHCRTTRHATPDECRLLRCDPKQPPEIGVAVGCSHCHNTGYRGRTAIAEILRVTPELDALIAANAPRHELQKQIRAEGFTTMAEDGIAKVMAHEISLDNLRRAVDLTRPDSMRIS
jgi:general secretion pathway protein E/type IV pilus assembly protein PilB